MTLCKLQPDLAKVKNSRKFARINNNVQKIVAIYSLDRLVGVLNETNSKLQKKSTFLYTEIWTLGNL